MDSHPSYRKEELKNMILNLLYPVFLLMIVFVYSALIISLIKKCTFKESIIVIKNWIHTNFFNDQKQQVYFPAEIGFDGFHFNLVNASQSFARLEKCFDVCYLESCHRFANDNCVAYLFKVHKKETNDNDKALLELTQKIAESILQDHFREYEFYYPAEPVTHVEFLSKDKLVVAYARTQNGILALDQRKTLKYRNNNEAKLANVQKKAMTEEWEND